MSGTVDGDADISQVVNGIPVQNADEGTNNSAGITSMEVSKDDDVELHPWTYAVPCLNALEYDGKEITTHLWLEELIDQPQEVPAPKTEEEIFAEESPAICVKLMVKVGPLEVRDIHQNLDKPLLDLLKIAPRFKIKFGVDPSTVPVEERKLICTAEQRALGYLEIPFSCNSCKALVNLDDLLKDFKIPGRHVATKLSDEFQNCVKVHKGTFEDFRKRKEEYERKKQLEAERKAKTAYANNIPPQATEELLKDLIPGVEEAILPKFQDGTSKGYAELMFTTADKCTEWKQRKTMNIGSYQILIEDVFKETKRDDRLVYANHIPPYATVELLRDLIPGPKITIPTQEDGQNKSYAVLWFNTNVEAQNFLRKKKQLVVGARKILLEKICMDSEEYGKEDKTGKGAEVKKETETEDKKEKEIKTKVEVEPEDEQIEITDSDMEDIAEQIAAEEEAPLSPESSLALADPSLSNKEETEAPQQKMETDIQIKPELKTPKVKPEQKIAEKEKSQSKMSAEGDSRKDKKMESLPRKEVMEEKEDKFKLSSKKQTEEENKKEILAKKGEKEENKTKSTDKNDKKEEKKIESDKTDGKKKSLPVKTAVLHFQSEALGKGSKSELKRDREKRDGRDKKTSSSSSSRRERSRSRERVGDKSRRMRSRSRSKGRDSDRSRDRNRDRGRRERSRERRHEGHGPRQDDRSHRDDRGHRGHGGGQDSSKDNLKAVMELMQKQMASLQEKLDAKLEDSPEPYGLDLDDVDDFGPVPMDIPDLRDIHIDLEPGPSYVGGGVAMIRDLQQQVDQMKQKLNVRQRSQSGGSFTDRQESAEVFVKNIPRGTKLYEIEDLIKDYSYRLIELKEDKRFCFIKCGSIEDADQLIDFLDFMAWNGVVLKANLSKKSQKALTEKSRTDMEPPDKIEVFVSNLPESRSKKEFLELIQNVNHGEVDWKDDKRFCFVTCGSFGDAKNLVYRLNGIEWLGTRLSAEYSKATEKWLQEHGEPSEGQPLKRKSFGGSPAPVSLKKSNTKLAVQPKVAGWKAKQKQKQPGFGQKSPVGKGKFQVYVGNLPIATTKQEFMDLLRPFKPRRVIWPPKKKSASRFRYGIVDFDNAGKAKQLIQNMDGSTYRDKELKVTSYDMGRQRRMEQGQVAIEVQQLQLSGSGTN